MKTTTALAVVAALAACHHQATEQAGPAPAARDTSAVTHQVDPGRTGPPGTGGRASNGTVGTDSLGLDTARTKVDSASTGAAPGVSTPQDTLGPRATDSSATDTTRSAR